MLSFCCYFYSSYNVFSNTLSASKLTKSCFCLSPFAIYSFYHILCLLSYFLAYGLLFDFLKTTSKILCFCWNSQLFLFPWNFLDFLQSAIYEFPTCEFLCIYQLPHEWSLVFYLAHCVRSFVMTIFIINLISLKITQILRDVHSWVYLPWHFQGQFNYMCCELANESSLGGFIIPLLGDDGRHEAGLIGGSRHLWHIFEAIFCLGFFCLPFSAFCLSGRKEKPLPTLLTSSYFI